MGYVAPGRGGLGERPADLVVGRRAAGMVIHYSDSRHHASKDVTLHMCTTLQMYEAKPEQPLKAAVTLKAEGLPFNADSTVCRAMSSTEHASELTFVCTGKRPQNGLVSRWSHTAECFSAEC